MARLDGQIAWSKTGNTVFVMLPRELPNGNRYVVVTPIALERSTRVTGPDGGRLRMEHLARGLRVRVDVRGNNLDRLLEVEYDDAARRAVREQERADAERAALEDEARARDAILSGGNDVNPYTFLPFITPRTAEAPFASRPRDRAEPAPALRSGRIRLRLGVTTPLATYGGETVVPATHKSESDRRTGEFRYVPLGGGGGEHRSTTLLRDASGAPTLAGAAVKGALRSWFEVITGSNREVDTEGIAWRDTVLDDTARQVAVLHLTVPDGDGGRAPWAGELDARSERFDRGLPSGLKLSITPVGSRRPTDAVGSARARTEAWLAALAADWTPVGHENGRHEYKHGALLKHTDGRRARIQIGLGVGGRPTVGARLVDVDETWVDEHGVLVPPGRGTTLVGDVLTRWRRANAQAGENQNLQRNRVRVDGATVTVQPPDVRQLSHGDLVFVEQAVSGDVRYLGRIRNGRWSVTRLDRSRWPVEPHGSDVVDPAQQVFGHVRQADQATGDTGDAWAGHVRIGRITYEGAAATRTYTLKPLLSPKVQAAGFYLQADGPIGVSWKRGVAGRLRGTKVYWHQPDLRDANGNVTVGARVAATATALTDDGQPARMQSNATVEALHDGHFDVEIWFEDVTDDELGALLLATTLQLTGKDSNVPRGWKLGMGKPLGLGSVENVLVGVDLIEEPTPTSLGVRGCDADRIAAMLDDARRRWLQDAGHAAEVIDGIARHDGVARSTVGYRDMGDPGRDSDGNFKQTPTAAEVLGDQSVTDGTVVFACLGRSDVRDVDVADGARDRSPPVPVEWERSRLRPLVERALEEGPLRVVLICTDQTDGSGGDEDAHPHDTAALGPEVRDQLRLAVPDAEVAVETVVRLRPDVRSPALDRALTGIVAKHVSPEVEPTPRIVVAGSGGTPAMRSSLESITARLGDDVWVGHGRRSRRRPAHVSVRRDDLVAALRGAAGADTDSGQRLADSLLLLGLPATALPEDVQVPIEVGHRGERARSAVRRFRGTVRRFGATVAGREGGGSWLVALAVIIGVGLVLESAIVVLDDAGGAMALLGVGLLVAVVGMGVLHQRIKQSDREDEVHTVVRIAPPLGFKESRYQLQTLAGRRLLTVTRLDQESGEESVDESTWPEGGPVPDAVVATSNLALLLRLLTDLHASGRGGRACDIRLIAGAEGTDEFATLARDVVASRRVSSGEAAWSAGHDVEVLDSRTVPTSASYDSQAEAIGEALDEVLLRLVGYRGRRGVLVDISTGNPTQRTALIHEAHRRNLRIGIVASRGGATLDGLRILDFDL